MEYHSRRLGKGGTSLRISTRQRSNKCDRNTRRPRYPPPHPQPSTLTFKPQTMAPPETGIHRCGGAVMNLSPSLPHSLTPSPPHSLTPSLPHSLTSSLPGGEGGRKYEPAYRTTALDVDTVSSDIAHVLSPHPSPLPSQFGADKTVKARFWPWLSGSSP